MCREEDQRKHVENDNGHATFLSFARAEVQDFEFPASEIHSALWVSSDDARSYATYIYQTRYP